MAVIRNAFRSVSRRLFRTILVAILLGLCVAVLISTIAGVRTGQSGTQALVNDVETSTATLIAEVESSTAAMVTEVESSTATLLSGVEESTLAMVAEVEASTDKIVAQVEANAETTIDLTEMMNRMITVSKIIQPMLNESDVIDISAIAGIETVIPRFNRRVGGSGGLRSQDYNYIVIGVPLESAILDNYPVFSPLLISDGRTLNEDDGAAIMIKQDLVTYFNAGVGDTVNLGGTDFTIVGIFYSTGVQNPKMIYMSLQNAQDLFRAGDRVSSIQVFVESSDMVNTVATNIEALNDSWRVSTIEDMQTAGIGQSIVQTQEEQIAIILDQTDQQIKAIKSRAAAQIADIQDSAEDQLAAMQMNADEQITTAQNSSSDQLAEMQMNADEQITAAQNSSSFQLAAMQADLDNINRLGLQVILVSGGVGLLMIFGIMFYIVRERSREIGTLKALGFSNMYVMKRFVLEGLFIGLLGGLIGIGLGAATSSFMVPKLLSLDSAIRVTFGPEYLFIGLGAAAILGATGSLYPAWLASKVSPMMALKQE